MRSRPDSGIAVSTSSASYASSEHHKDTIDDIDEPCLTTSCQEMVEKVKQVREVKLSLFYCFVGSNLIHFWEGALGPFGLGILSVFSNKLGNIVK